MSGAIYSKWEALQAGHDIDISGDELERVTMRDFIDIAADTGLSISAIRLSRGWFRLVVQS